MKKNGNGMGLGVYAFAFAFSFFQMIPNVCFCFLVYLPKMGLDERNQDEKTSCIFNDI
jgi:hypothetical protein